MLARAQCPQAYITIPPLTYFANTNGWADIPCASPIFGGALTTSGIIANGAIGILPVNAKLRAIYIGNTTANAVTGGINIGTAALGSDVVSAAVVGANGLVTISGASLLKTWVSLTAATPLFISAVTAWNAASVSVELVFDQ